MGASARTQNLADVEGATLSTTDVAAMIGVHRNKLRRMVAAGAVPGLRRGRVYRFRPEEVEAFLEANRVRPGSLGWAHHVVGCRGPPLAVIASRSVCDAIVRRLGMPVGGLQDGQHARP